ncbi:MAG: hypothetical protein NUV98_01695 [Candidatus Roizmanbacteria bacterium]|nr:hypothetical protein [Candidatus Roizmanbacteria bacterium]
MRHKIKTVATLVFTFGMFVLYITNNIHLESFAKKIEREMIIPYSQRFSSLEEVGSVVPDIDEISPTDTPTSTPELTEEKAEPQPTANVRSATSTSSEISISEDDLWQALSAYRSTHGKSTIEKSEALCSYARFRSQELFDRLQTNPDDPLDAHAGFSRDADSGYVFEVTGYNTVGENLAYTPGYTNATQIIEWGWDTSPGHRSLQLSDDVTHGCISGIHPIYVGIFTY